MSLSPIASLYYIAPTCFLCLLIPWAHFEARAVLAGEGAAFRTVGALTLLANASLAFALNIGTMALIKHTSALTLNVAGVAKDLLLIIWSVVVSGAVVTGLQYVGYAIAFSGVTGYSAYKRAAAAAAKAAQESASADTEPTDEVKEEEPLLARGGAVEGRR